MQLLYISSFSSLFRSSLGREMPINSNRIAGKWPQEREEGSLNNYPTSKIRIWSIHSEVFGSRHPLCTREPFTEKVSLLIFQTENLSLSWLSGEMRIRGGDRWAFMSWKWGRKTLRWLFFNLGNIVFTRTRHCFSWCEKAHNHSINGALSGMERRLKAYGIHILNQGQRCSV